MNAKKLTRVSNKIKPVEGELTSSAVTLDTAFSASPSNDNALLPRVVGSGTLELGAAAIPCAVLENGQKVLETSGVERVLGLSSVHRNSGRQIARLSLRASGIDCRPILFVGARGGDAGRRAGYLGADLVGLAHGIVGMAIDGKLHHAQKPVATRAHAFLKALGNVAIEALIEEACGIQTAPGAHQERFQGHLAEAAASSALAETKASLASAQEILVSVVQTLAKITQAVNDNTRMIAELQTKFAMGSYPQGLIGRDKARVLLDNVKSIASLHYPDRKSREWRSCRASIEKDLRRTVGLAWRRFEDLEAHMEPKAVLRLRELHEVAERDPEARKRRHPMLPSLDKKSSN